jgi:hypothetical protein
MIYQSVLLKYDSQLIIMCVPRTYCPTRIMLGFTDSHRWNYHHHQHIIFCKGWSSYPVPSSGMKYQPVAKLLPCRAYSRYSSLTTANESCFPPCKPGKVPLPSTTQWASGTLRSPKGPRPLDQCRFRAVQFSSVQTLQRQCSRCI